MTVDTTTDLDAIEHLDWQHVVPCEYMDALYTECKPRNPATHLGSYVCPGHAEPCATSKPNIPTCPACIEAAVAFIRLVRSRLSGPRCDTCSAPITPDGLRFVPIGGA